jgi:hypothetical protein
MMKVIYKYRIPVISEVLVRMPEGARILNVGLQNEQAHMWVEVNLNGKMEDYFFRWVATGEQYDRGEYVGTLHTPPFVWHLFRVWPEGVKG